MILVAKRVASRDVLDSDDRGDVARVTGLDVFAFVRLDLNQTRNALTFVRARIVNVVAFAERAGINAEENEFPDKRIAPQFEREGTEVSVVVRRRFHRLVRVGLHAFGRRNVERARQIIDNRVDQILNTNILQR